MWASALSWSMGMIHGWSFLLVHQPATTSKETTFRTIALTDGIPVSSCFGQRVIWPSLLLLTWFLIEYSDSNNWHRVAITFAEMTRRQYFEPVKLPNKCHQNSSDLKVFHQHLNENGNQTWPHYLTFTTVHKSRWCLQRYSEPMRQVTWPANGVCVCVCELSMYTCRIFDWVGFG